ncbi:sulfite exporter TauE/SafE family protein [Albimonas pacifica]|uniref:Probable membrane transporter protein n=1 Tax=Albimonas pacifica TaxID=1114924 RepID=A0A1I3EBH9_9RHOB|nr:sulfite exporter TauE/SafE family protein [Albimonas pacifica]SFH96324.1 hypothetical protein SAMN05216258_103281 [Albimonas pacifica]
MEALSTLLAEQAPQAGTLVLACLSVAVAGVLRGLTGFGFALAAVPLLSMFLVPAQAVALVICMQALVGFRDVVQVGRLVEWPAVGRLSLGAIVGTPVGVALLAWLDPAAMRLAIAALVGIGLAMLLRPGRAPVPTPEGEAPSSRGALPTGVLSGLFGGLAAMAGPPAIVWFMRGGRPPAVMRASLMVFFFATSIIAAPMLVWSGVLDLRVLILGLCALPALVLSTSAGARLFARTSDAGYRRVALGVLAAMAAASALRGALDLLGG